VFPTVSPDRDSPLTLLPEFPEMFLPARAEARPSQSTSNLQKPTIHAPLIVADLLSIPNFTGAICR
jgi:hypothetical protein